MVVKLPLQYKVLEDTVGLQKTDEIRAGIGLTTNNPLYWESIPKKYTDFNTLWLGDEYHPKEGKTTAQFDYQIKMQEALLEHRKLIVNKFTGAGGTASAFRIFLHMAVTMELPFKQYAIVTGLSEEFSKELLEERLKPLIEDRHPELISRKVRDRLELVSGHYFKTYPTKRVKALRGQKDLQAIFVDEDAFFDEGDQTELEFSIERYKLKTNPYILRVSTPNGNTGLYYRNFIDAQKGLNDYHPMTINYREGIANNLFTLAEIEEQLAKKGKLRMFAQEYDNQFLSPLGSIMSPIRKDQMTLKEEIL